MTLEVGLELMIGNRPTQTIDEERDSECARHFLGDLGILRKCFFVRASANSMLGPLLGFLDMCKWHVSPVLNVVHNL